MAPWTQESFKMDRYIFVDSHDESWIWGSNNIRWTSRRGRSSGPVWWLCICTRYSLCTQADLQSAILSNEPYEPDLQPCLLIFYQPVAVTDPFRSPKHRKSPHFPAISLSAPHRNRSVKSEHTRFEISTSEILLAIVTIWTYFVCAKIPCRVRG